MALLIKICSVLGTTVGYNRLVISIKNAETEVCVIENGNILFVKDA